MKIYCDGSCLGNPGLGGWAAIFIKEDKIIKKIYGCDKHTTNNKMELTAAIKSLENLEIMDNMIEIYTDSNYLKCGITEWIKNWKINNWKNGKIKNIEYWKDLDKLNSVYNTKWFWVKAHNGNKFNEIVDKLARNAAVNQIELN
ncbi:ribonuclease H [Rickettsiales endosymbiont of Trichoplax sp. H2]|uniref:ribonuclease H family protein n=1 Tax=Rickettsiales endosymbiont of Trichoplax sp. H2 TaxID=2021221 RepID=UPI0012B311CD|nr:ribonuclease H [Rickettsiales endosymbiont of Trichoplax sp. H2]MSO14490.1 Ribonuclease H [Rickettsiales endosymbiont of Trichoplax sp. H2]